MKTGLIESAPTPQDYEKRKDYGMPLPSGSLRHAILLQLYRSPMHGYGLRQAAGEHGWIYRINASAVYPALHELEEEGLVTHETEIHAGRARKIYTITDAGRREFEEWLISAPENELFFFDPVAFKVAACRAETVQHARRWMKESISKLREQIDDRERRLENDRDMDDYVRLVEEYGLDMLRLRVRLLGRVLEGAESSGARPVAAQG